MSFTKNLVRDIETLSASLQPNQLKQFLDIMDTLSALLAKAQEDNQSGSKVAKQGATEAHSSTKSAFH